MTTYHHHDSEEDYTMVLITDLFPANTAASFMGLAWLTTYSVFMLTQVLYEDIGLTTKVVLSLISNTAMGYAFQMLIMCEGTSEGKRYVSSGSDLNQRKKIKSLIVYLKLESESESSLLTFITGPVFALHTLAVISNK